MLKKILVCKPNQTNQLFTAAMKGYPQKMATGSTFAEAVGTLVGLGSKELSLEIESFEQFDAFTKALNSKKLFVLNPEKPGEQYVAGYTSAFMKGAKTASDAINGLTGRMPEEFGEDEIEYFDDRDAFERALKQASQK